MAFKFHSPPSPRADQPLFRGSLVNAAIRRLALGLLLVVRAWSVEMQAIVHELQTTSLPKISTNLARALVEGEDHRFRIHVGVDFWALARAIKNTVLMHRRQGASTIQQQLVRVVSGRRELTIRRKIREIVLGVALGKYFDRDEMLALYLVKGYYGRQMSGLFQACRKLGIDPAVAGPAEAAGLVARLKYPEPSTKSARQRKRINDRTQHILGKMEPTRKASRTKKLGPSKTATRPATGMSSE